MDGTSDFDLRDQSLPQPTRIARLRALWRTSPNLRLRLILLVAGSMVPLLLLAGIVVFQNYQSARTAAGERVLQTTRSTMATVDRELQNQIAALRVLALSPALQAGDMTAFRAEAERFVRQLPQGTAFSVSDASGRQLVNTGADEGQELPPRRDMRAIAAVFQTRAPYVSDIYLSTLLQRPILTVDVPVIKDGEVIYDLALLPSREIFVDILKRLNLPEDWVVSIFDRNFHHIARMPAFGDGNGLTSAAESLSIQMRGQDNRIVETVSLEGTTLLTAFSRSADSGWIVAIGMPRDALTTPARHTFLAMIGAGLVLMLIGLASASHIATQLARDEHHRELLMNELNHRVKNTLSTVQAIVARGLQDSPASKESRDAIEARLMALSRTHNILSNRNWASAELRDVAAGILEPYAGRLLARAPMRGPKVLLTPRVAIALAMVLNELVTNAAKYGALSSVNGVVELSWDFIGDNRIQIDWREVGGPPVGAPTRPGYGTRFIERAVESELQGRHTISYAGDGLTCLIEIQL